MRYEVEVAGRTRAVTLHRADGRFIVSIDGREQVVDAVPSGPHLLSLLIDGASHEVAVAPAGPGRWTVRVGTTVLPVVLNGRRSWGRGEPGDRAAAGPQRIVAPMPGRVVRVLVKSGDPVRARQPVVVVEAMKMENELRSLHDGVVTDVKVRDGQSVDAGALLAIVAPEARP
jgi:biotin carboxyl carrier protein